MSRKELKSVTSDQFNAVGVVLNNIVNNDDKFTVITGSAGTGKTFIINELKDFFEFNMLYSVEVCALTGKAASHMSHGRTLHSVFYEKELDNYGEFIGFKLRDTNEFTSWNRLFIIDEASMVSEEMINFFMEIEGKFIFFGDTKQLPPINSEDINILDWTDYEIEEIVRTKKDDPLINLSLNAYHHNIIDTDWIDNKNIKLFGKKQGLGSILKENDYDIILCGTNRQRKRLNSMVRQIKGHESDTPEIGERIISLKNDYKNGEPLFNGQIYKVHDKRYVSRYLHTYSLFDERTNRIIKDIKIPNHLFEQDANSSNSIITKDGESAFTYGYAITVHKSQGDEFDRVLFVDEDVSYFLPQNRFRYTAITRAVETLHIKKV